MAVLEFPKNNDTGREVLIALPDGDHVILRSQSVLTVKDAVFLLERARLRIFLSLEDLDKVDHGKS